MITGSELVNLVRNDEVFEATMELKKDFMKASSFMHLGDDDFIALIMLAPSVGVALANGSVSLFEELSLNKKMRKLSRKSFFQKHDPLTPALQFLVRRFNVWENRFYEVLKLTMHSSLKKNDVILDSLKNPASLTGDFTIDILNAPYIFVKFLSFLFLDEEDDLLNQRTINKVEHEKIIAIGNYLELDNIPLFQEFCETFIIKEEIVYQA
ncbi:hypothetical protein [Sediminitomix flava]|uniref:Uncharacterized protein n=1 Tax=Sediminitomix flava TaxID=379075 RepID=A0A315ZI86_SEDFL|nr:hypothetical protein [Sediminitomix flava]PWJ44820.1 hypothetical protein BC781_1011199 [Sediminitomix flava]